MSEAIAMTKNTAPARRPLEVFVEGKIVSQRRHENRQYTVIRCAAADAYSHPSTLEVRSAGRLGDVDQVIQLECRISGTLRTFNYVKDGEQRKGNEAKVFFDVIE